MRAASFASGDDTLFIGIDLGTGGVRALAAGTTGQVVAHCEVALEPALPTRIEGGHEQDPLNWWEAVCQALGELMQALDAAGVSPQALRALAVDGTSGTLVCLDREGQPARSALMYNDARARIEAAELTDQAEDFCQRLGYRFEASFALAKIAWVQRHEPGVFERTFCFAHQADYIQGCLIGETGTADYSNALKTGYDLIEECWPQWILQLPGVGERLPRIVAPGTRVGQVGRVAARQTGLPQGLAVVSGATDGTAACLASGVQRIGDYNTTLGTTLVFKGISRQLVRHPEGLVYCHKLPGGYWLPGAASNTGGEWIETLFPAADIQSMDVGARPYLPSRHIAYPLARQGERFPFRAGAAKGFCIPEPVSETERYAAHLQGVALVERLGYQVLDQVAGTSGGEVFSTGGGSRSPVWMQYRADATGRRMHLPACPESALGCAILAAAGGFYGDLWVAVQNMVRIEKSFEPNPAHADRYGELFDGFCAEIGKRGYK